MAEQIINYPVKFQIDYPDRNLDRLTSFFRMFTFIPIYLILVLLLKSSSTGLILIPTIFMILFQQKYPRWWFDWNFAMTKFLNRISAYLFLMTDTYPSTDEDQSVHIEIQYPDAKKDINRWTAAGKMVSGNPPLYSAVFLNDSSICLRYYRLVCHSH